MKILVTGGAGFIGSNLCRRLLAEGHEVICLDNFFTGRRQNVATLSKVYPGRFTIVEHDVVNPLVGFTVDQIYNLACPASPPHYQFDPIKTTETSFLGAMNMLRLANDCGATVLQASTSEVYGDPDPRVHPQPESYWGNVNPIGVRSCYDEGKRVAETLFMDYHRQYGTNIRIVRIFNTYGPMMAPDDGRVVSNFIMQALRGEDLTVYGDGEQTRSFQFVDDLIDGMVRMMNNDSGAIGPINLGNPAEFTIRELAEEVLAQIPGSQSQLVSLPLPVDDPRQRQPDIATAKSVLDWQPRVRLREGLVPTIEYFREELERDAACAAHVYDTAARV